MNSITRFFNKIGMLLRRERFNSELDEEMAFHREQKEKEFREAGVDPGEARHAAVRRSRRCPGPQAAWEPPPVDTLLNSAER